MIVADEKHAVPQGFELIACPGCDSWCWTIARVGRDWALDRARVVQIVRCDECGLHYTNPRPVAAELGKYYSSEYGPYRRQRGEVERGSKLSTAIRLLVLRNAYGAPQVKSGVMGRMAASAISLVKRPQQWGFAVPYHGRGRLLDFGCGNGTFLRRMHALGWDVSGIDFSEAAVRAVRESGLRGYHGSLPHEELGAGNFDVITMRSSLEHLLNPRQVLVAARELLDRDGLLVIQVPNFASWEIEYFADAALSLDLPRHLLHFTAQTLRGMLERCGFQVRDLRVISRAGGLRKSLAQINRRERRGSDVFFRSKLICQLAAARASWRGMGNELLAVATGGSG